MNAAWEREARELRACLTVLTNAVQAFLGDLDAEMAKPPGHQRGRMIAELANRLNYANDQARYFGLGIDFRGDIRTERLT